MQRKPEMYEPTDVTKTLKILWQQGSNCLANCVATAINTLGHPDELISPEEVNRIFDARRAPVNVPSVLAQINALDGFSAVYYQVVFVDVRSLYASIVKEIDGGNLVYISVSGGRWAEHVLQRTTRIMSPIEFAVEALLGEDGIPHAVLAYGYDDRTRSLHLCDSYAEDHIVTAGDLVEALPYQGVFFQQDALIGVFSVG